MQFLVIEMDHYILVNFGGPRYLGEIQEFLVELLTDQEVVRSDLRPFFHRLLFKRIAKKRAEKVAKDYELIGGKSPIFEETEQLAKRLEEKLGAVVIPFHRYLPKTHPSFIDQVKSYGTPVWKVLPLFPQFSYATTGSAAKFFIENLPGDVVANMRWIKSYPSHEKFIALHVENIRAFLKEKGIMEEECTLLFSAHGVPEKFIASGDLYRDECESSFNLVMRNFPKALGRLSYQSIFGKEEWIKPYTKEVCERVLEWNEARPHLLVVPISFTSDHIETLYEIEHEYIPLLRERGVLADRLNAFKVDDPWIETVAELFKAKELTNTAMLVRRPGCSTKCSTCVKRCRR